MMLSPRPLDLPPPDNTAAHISEKLTALIACKIQQEGPISFADFMNLALYAPGLGYYSAGSCKFGEAGDFVTSPEISPLFAGCIATEAAQVLETLGHGDILELGAGTGKLAAELLLRLQQQDCLPDHYYILEISAELKQRQQAYLRQHIPELLSRVSWLDALPSHPITGVILANEVLDALPVHQFVQQESVRECLVNFSSQRGFFWELAASTPNTVTEQVEALKIEFTAGYRSEINLLLTGWLQSLSDCLQRGLMLFFDYGFPRHEYYHPDRSMGTLMCHYRHRSHTDPLILIGLQDITSHVDFTAVAAAAINANLTVAGFCTQGTWLLNCGLLNNTQEFSALSPEQQWRLAQQIKRLTLPSEMGELIKVMGLTRGLNSPLQGFSKYDMRHRL